MMAERIDHAADAPLVLVGDWIDFFRAGGNRAGKHGVGIGHRKNDANRRTTDGFWTEVMVLGRFVAQPEFRTFDRKTGHNAAAIFHSEQFGRAESRFIEVNGARSAAKT